MTMMMAARVMFTCVPVVRSGFAGGRSSVMAAGLRSWIGWRFRALRGENCGRENQCKYCNDLFHLRHSRKIRFLRERIEPHPRRKV